MKWLGSATLVAALGLYLTGVFLLPGSIVTLQRCAAAAFLMGVVVLIMSRAEKPVD